MQGVLGADQHRIGQFSGVGGLLPVGEHLIRRNTVLFDELLPINITRFGYRDDLH
ncbi:hypothetical protein D3C72_2035020 [compost metagenome]